MNQYEEHLAHSAPCNSRWDGFDRGDLAESPADQGQRVIGRMASSRGRVTVTEFWCGRDSFFEVAVGSNQVHWTNDRANAITVARWWVIGCPA
jgi:hypothetical protein